MIVSQTVFDWFLAIMIVGICVGWGARDLIMLSRNWKRREDLHDEVFGHIIGLVVIFLGVVSLFKHHLGLGWW